MVGSGEIRCIIGRPTLRGIEPNIELEGLGNAPNVSKFVQNATAASAHSLDSKHMIENSCGRGPVWAEI
jgi:hypothetical protein